LGLATGERHFWPEEDDDDDDHEEGKPQMRWVEKLVGRRGINHHSASSSSFHQKLTCDDTSTNTTGVNPPL